ncbi:MAG: sulfurtransferase [Halanaerobium sp. MSAO_Bac5]|nr:MAG: sulfurtransferase [Halanaerobium sp. MSAO_Bac5]
MQKKTIIVLVVAVLILGGGLFYEATLYTDLDIDMEGYVPIEERGYANTDSLISAMELNEIKDRDDVAVIDFRRADAYAMGHIPGAIQVWRSDVTDPDHEYAGMRISHEGLADWLGENGISHDDTVVVYTSGGGHDAARMWWMMTMLGHEDVRLLDGQLDFWRALDYDIALSSPGRDAVEYEMGEIDESMLVDADDVLAAIDDDDKNIVDTRSYDEYTGADRVNPAERAGRIPTPIWIDWTENLNEDNLIKTADELRDIYEAEGVTPDKAAYNYCQSGVRSSHTTFVLSQLLGYEDVANYDGSWIEWSAREDLPIESDQ